MRAQREQDVIWHYVIAALIFDPGYEVSPFEQGLEHRGLGDGVVCAVSLDDHLVIEVFCDMLFVDFERYSVASVVCLLQKLIWII